jgi:hypothetical protein
MSKPEQETGAAAERLTAIKPISAYPRLAGKTIQPILNVRLLQRYRHDARQSAHRDTAPGLEAP